MGAFFRLSSSSLVIGFPVTRLSQSPLYKYSAMAVRESRFASLADRERTSGASADLPVPLVDGTPGRGEGVGAEAFVVLEAPPEVMHSAQSV